MHNTTQNRNNSSALGDFVAKYSDYLSKHKDEVDFGSDLLSTGSKTEVIQTIEKFFSNPVDSLIFARNSIDSSLMSFVNKIMSVFFDKAKEQGIIGFVSKKESGSSIIYFICLTNDNFENRNDMFNFLNFYSTLDISEKISVRFQFIPAEMCEVYHEFRPNVTA